ncbi:MAG: cyclase [Acidobacteria bacterium]|nr:cyclase [Acidobacteriota bacterium]|tara:strand:- start:1708 stop:2727 length:1020 start_codon:yes stop_codon:yes gene_type:complete
MLNFTATNHPLTTPKSTIVLLLALLLLVPVTDALGQGAESVSRTDFNRWMKEISNWGRWGSDDERGTLNLITNERRLAATQLVREGTSVSMALELNTRLGPVNTNPFEHSLTVSTFSDHEVAGDVYRVQYHGFAHSHVDGLPHFAHNGQLYNGFPVSGLTSGGAERLGIHNAHEGIVTRGVLVDMPRHKGVDYLEPGTAITISDLESWEQATGLRIGSGDVLLIRTGRWDAVRQLGQWNFVERAAGSHASVAKWLKTRDVAVIGSDGVSDVMPSGIDGLANPLHELVIVGLGMPILDNLDLDAVAQAAHERQRWEFLFVGAPLRVRGGTGSPLNPIAIF